MAKKAAPRRKTGKTAKYVYFFGGGKADGNRGMRDTLGGKGAGLAEMTNAGLPVPPGFTISTDVCSLYYKQKGKIPSAVDAQIAENIKKLEKAAGATFGSTENPLLVSVRSGAKFSMPGMMDTILNLGLNDKAVEGLKARTANGRFAYDSYRRFMQMFGSVVLEIPKDVFEHEFEAVKQATGATLDTELDEQALREVVERYKRVVRDRAKRDFPQEPREQLKMARDAVFRSWMNPRAQEYRRIYDIPDHIGTAVNVQMMVFGNTGDRSATGVGFTRNPATGAKEFYGEFLVNAQGEDVVAGIRTPQPIAELEKVLPKAYKQLREITTRLERNYKDVQDFEFTIQDERLFMLQTRNGKRTGYAAVIIATDFVAERLITPKEAILQIDPESLSQLLAPGFDQKEWTSIPVATRGLPASPGAASGQVVFSAEDAVRWSDEGKPVILVRRETVPDDIRGMFVAQGVLTATGGMTSHAAVVGRQMGKPSIVGASALEVDEDGKRFSVDGHTIREGDFVSFDGLTGEVKLAKVASKPSEILQVLSGQLERKKSDIFRRFMQILTWSDKYRRMNVRANADQPDQAELAYAFGARGIGLCRTEHMFFGEGRIPIVQRMILADNEKDRRAALDELLPLQREDFYGVFKAMKGEPVTIRTIDPPLHEFLPKREELMVEIARLESRAPQRRRTRSEAQAAPPRRAAPRVQPDARPSRRAARHHVSRDHRDADARHHRGGLPAGEGRREGHAGDHDPARRAREGAARPEGGRQPRRRGGDEGAGRQGELPRRDDDRGAARGDDGRRDRDRGGVLFVRHQRPDADDLRVLARRHRQVPARLPGQEDPRQGSVCDLRRRRRRAGDADRRRAGTPHAPRSQDRRLRRARWRSLVDPFLREGRAQLRELLALPRAGRASCRRAGGAGGQSRGLMPGPLRGQLGP